MVEPFENTLEIYKHPIACVGGKVYKMVPILEFIDRLVLATKGTTRNCDNEIEAGRSQLIQDLIEADICEKQNLEPTYLNERRLADDPGIKLTEKSALSGWYTLLHKMLPNEYTDPVNLT